MSESLITFEEFLQKNGVSRLWKKEQEAQVQELGSLPLETFIQTQAPIASRPKALTEKFDETLSEVQKGLAATKRSLVLARSASLSPEKRSALVSDARAQWDQACQGLKTLKVYSRKLETEDRRLVTALEGLPEWRRLRHQIQKSEKELKNRREFQAA